MADLRRNSLSFVEAIGQSVANVSPTLTPALVVAVVAGLAGAATWLVFLFASISLLIVGFNVGNLARHIPSAGSFFIYVSRSLGTVWGMLAGWAMLLAYIFTAMALSVATSSFIKTFFAALGVDPHIPNLVYYLVISVMIYVVAVRDVRISARVGLILEGVSAALILLVCAFTWAHSGFTIDTKQVHLGGSLNSGLFQAVVFAIFSYVGFESAATLGAETRNPERNTPRAVIFTPIIAGLFFMITSYVIVLGFGDDAGKLGVSAAPLGDLTSKMSPWLTALVYFGAAISGFACALASLNAFGRMLFSMGRYQFVHQTMGMVHIKRQTPHYALLFGAAINFVVLATFSNHAEMDLVGYYATIATFGFLFVYFLCSVAAPLFLRKLGLASVGSVVMGALGAALMLLVILGSVYPVPAYPNNLWPYVFVAYMLAGAAWFLVLRSRSPQVLLGIAHDLEVARIPHYGKIEI